MARLIRLDRTGHTTLAEWTDGDPAAREAALCRPSGASSTTACWPASLARTAAPRSSGSCRSTRSWWCCAARSPAASHVPAERRQAPPPPNARPDGLAEAAALWWREEVSERDAAPRRAAVDGMDGLGRHRFHDPRDRPAAPLPADARRSRSAASRTRGSSPGSRRAGERASVVPLGERARARAALAAPIPRRTAWRSGCSPTWSVTTSASCSRATGLVLERGELGTWLVGERGALWSGPGAAGWTAGAFGWPSRTGCRAATGSPTCCWRCARTSAASRRWRTSASRVRRGGFGAGCRSARVRRSTRRGARPARHG